MAHSVPVEGGVIRKGTRLGADHIAALKAAGVAEVTIAAMEAGADVYVQKPISVDVLEGEAMLAAARRHQRVVQVGTQRKST
ncbi:MAG: Gfo/Idh/MocA family oxidoreductase, partial [Paracoccaceae bacterium]